MYPIPYVVKKIPFDIIHIDIWGPAIESIGGA